jgi:hypothetical protein
VQETLASISSTTKKQQQKKFRYAVYTNLLQRERWTEAGFSEMRRFEQLPKPKFYKLWFVVVNLFNFKNISFFE